MHNFRVSVVFPVAIVSLMFLACQKQDRQVTTSVSTPSSDAKTQAGSKQTAAQPEKTLSAKPSPSSTSGSKPNVAPKTKTESAKTSGDQAAQDSQTADSKPERSPAEYVVRLETTKGNIDIDVSRALAPRGADRFFNLVNRGYYTDVAFFRVIPNFMAQVGLHGDPAMNAKWRTNRIQDDPVKGSNIRGTVTFATSGPNSRTTQFFINFKNNARLDGMGFAPFGNVRAASLPILDSLHGGYGEGAPRGRGPMQGRIHREGNAYLKKEFPQLDYIKKATILK